MFKLSNDRYYTIKEIADRTGADISTIRRRLHNSRDVAFVLQPNDQNRVVKRKLSQGIVQRGTVRYLNSDRQCQILVENAA